MTHTGPDEILGDPTEPSAVRDAHAEQLGAGATIGRYVVVKRLGAGGMGVVFAAYDPQLDRKVALKLLHADRSVAGKEHTRLLREAQALARLSHPNVVTVYDVGTHDGQVWIAMEFVAGKTLSWWIRGHQPSTHALTEVLVQAARGLAAAHEAGLVHRDVKPDNLMVDGGADNTAPRLRVMDFGVARAAGQVRITGKMLAEPAPAPTVTVSGELVGTPAYMAPEQLANRAADAQSDQFALCVTAWEAVFGEKPFAGDSFVSYSANVVAGRVATPRRAGAAPRSLRRVLERGLAVDPKDRWPSMTALADAIDRDRGRVRRRWLAGAAALAGITIFATIVSRNVAVARRRTSCAEEGASIRETWNADVSADARAAMLASGVAGGEATYERIAARLDEHAARWESLRTELCTSATVDDTASAELHALGSECLDDRRVAMQATIAVLANADPEVVTNAVLAVVMLEALDPCVDEGWLRRRPRSPTEPEARARAAELRAAVFRVRALDTTGNEDAALALANELVDAAEPGAVSPELAELRQQIAQLETDAGHHERSVAIGREAFFAALGVGADEVASDAATELGFTLGHHLRRYDEGEAWARLALTLMERLGEGEGLRAATALDTLATIDLARGKIDEAWATQERVLALRERAFGESHPFVAQTLQQLGSIAEARSDFAAADPLYSRALEIERECLGPEHPLVANALDRLGVVRWRKGDIAGAEAMLLEAIRIAETARGAFHLDVAVPANSLGMLYSQADRLEEAQAQFERAARIMEAAFGGDSLYVAQVLGNLGNIQRRRGALDDAKRQYERALSIRERVVGGDDAQAIQTLTLLAEIAIAQRRASDAISLAERALASSKRVEVPPGLVARAQELLAEARDR